MNLYMSAQVLYTTTDLSQGIVLVRYHLWYLIKTIYMYFQSIKQLQQAYKVWIMHQDHYNY